MPTLPILGAGRGSSGYKKEPRRGPTSGGAQPNRGLSVAELPPMGRLANRSVSAEFRAKRKRSGPGSRIIVPTPNRPAGSYIPAIMSKRKNVQRWRVSRIRGSKNEVVGIVTASDREAAIQEAIELHQITDPEKQRRLVAWPEA
jgi:hypothetical protein